MPLVRSDIRYQEDSGFIFTTTILPGDDVLMQQMSISLLNLVDV